MGLTRPRAYQIFDIDYKQSVRVVTVSNVTLGGGAPSTVDGVSLSLNDRILVTAQSTGSQNGLYYVTTVGTGSNGTWARSVDGNETGEIDAGMVVMVTEGTTYADTQWKLTTNDPIVIGSTALTFVQNYLANSISSGTSNVVVTANSNVSIAVAGSNSVVFSSGAQNITANIIPTANITYALGNTTNRFKDIWLANSSIYLGNVTISADSTQLLVNGTNVVTSSGGTTSLTGNITGGNLITGGLVTATGNITGGNIQTGGLISATGNIAGANLSITADAVITGNLTVNGTTTTVNSNTVTINDKFINVANNASTSTLANGGGLGVGPVGTEYATLTYDQAANTWDTNIGVAVAGIISATGNITGGNILGGANVNATTHTGTTVSVTANITGGNILTSGLISATGNITGGNILGGANVNATTHTGTTVSVTANITGGNLISSALVQGVTVSASGNVTGGNLLTGGQLSATGTITSNGTTNGTAFAVGNSAVSNVALGFFPTAGTRGDYAIRDYSSVFSNMYFDVSIGGTANGAFQFRSSNTFTQFANINSLGITTPGRVYALELNSTQSSGDEGGQINLSLAATNTTLSGNVIIDVFQNKLRFYEGGGTNRGAYLDLTQASAGVATNLLAGGGGGTPGGSNTYVQFNDAGLFAGNAQFTYDKVTNTLTAGTFAGSLNGLGQNFKVGDDAWIGDINTADTIGLKGQQNAANCYIVFGNSDSTGKLGRAGTGPLTYAGAFSATGNVTGDNVLTAGLISATGNITGGNLSGTSIVGTLTTAAQTNITSVGTLGSLAVTGNTTSGNFVGTLNGSGANVTSISATNISSGTLAQARLANASVTLGSTALTLGATVTTVAGLTSVTSTTFVGALTGAATTAGTVTTAAQPNITSVGTLTSVTSSGAISTTGNVTAGNVITSGTGGNITGANVISATTLYATTLLNTGANGTGNIGSSTTYFNTVFAKATSAQYADLAEMYSADTEYAPGTVVEFGGTHEITISSCSHSTQVAGIISTNPSYLMNSAQAGDHVMPVALTGRVPCQVNGKIQKGDRLVASSTAGVATVLDKELYQPGCIIGKALEDYDSVENGIIEVAVGRF